MADLRPAGGKEGRWRFQEVIKKRVKTKPREHPEIEGAKTNAAVYVVSLLRVSALVGTCNLTERLFSHFSFEPSVAAF